jgi:ComF family protein
MLSGVYIASSLHNDLLKKAIHYYKYRFVKDLSGPLALLLAQALHNSHMIAPDMIIPVPLHPRRLRWRGFNQAEELAHALDLRIPVKTDILRRVRYTTPQVAMKNKVKRQKNLSGAFAVNDVSAVYGKKILLIDDVMTTGTTLTECATVLRSAGAYCVHCLVIARE